MRNTFIDTLAKKAQTNKNIALIVGDLGYSVVEKFAQSFPDRFFNAGVAEQNMAGMAAGLASEGFHVFIYSIANFPTFRCAEQIRNDIDYHNLPVTIVSVGAGLSYGNMGYSHHAIQDMALMRLFPNTLIAAPADPLEVYSCLNFLIENPQPSYLRLGKTGEKKITKLIDKIKPGEIYCQIDKGPEKKIILTTGTGLNVALSLVKKGILENNSIYTMPMWGAKFRKNLIPIMDKYDEITTVETHLLDGGFGSWLSECSRENSNKIKKICIDSRVMYSSATNEKLLEKFLIQE
jgi:transketolase